MRERMSGEKGGGMSGHSSRKSAQIEIHVVEDHPLYRAALAHTVGGVEDIRIRVMASSVEEFAACEPLPGAVVLLDLKLPGVSDAEAVATVAGLGFAVLVLSGHGGRSDVLAAMAAGAKGFLTKDADVDEICRAVRAVAAGGSYVAPTLAAFLLDAPLKHHRVVHVPLSDRERQILRLLADGERDRDIAATLAISIRTVHSHLDRIREKTGRRRRPELTRLAIENGIADGRHQVASPSAAPLRPRTT
jgi:DNA-binding NarL/FixJ family response regulator